MLEVLIYNRKTKRTWVASAEEAMLYISRLNGMQERYIVMTIREGRVLQAIELLSQIFHERRQRNNSV